MTAVYSQMVFDDHSLDAFALEQHALFDITLLTGLDLTWVSDGLQRVGAHVREPVDQKVRQLLAKGNLLLSSGVRFWRAAFKQCLVLHWLPGPAMGQTARAPRAAHALERPLRNLR